MTRPSARQPAPALQILVGLAGFTFLVHEVAWNRLLALTLGSTVVAATVVLTAFMAGFGVGAWYWGRRANDQRGVGRLLGLLLAGVGLSALATHLIVAGVIPGLAEPLASAMALCLLLAPAFLMGGVFPLAGKIAVTEHDDPSRALGRLYAVETLGSALGGLAAGYLLLGTLGQRGTMLTAVIIDIVLGAWLLLARRYDDVEPVAAAVGAPTGDATRAEKRRAAQGAAPTAANLRRTALVAAGAAGFAMLALQVVWLRAFRIYLTNTSYTFALISSLVILGLFAGSTLCARRGAGGPDPQRGLLQAVGWMALLAGAGLVVLVRLPQLVMFPLQDVLASPLARVTLLPLVASLLVVVPPAVCSGYVFPRACALAAAGRTGVSGDVGQVLMVNTAGAALGPLLVAFVLLPWLGAVGSGLVAIGVAAAALAVIAMRWRPAAGPASRYGWAAVAVVLVIGAVAGPPVRILPPSFHNQQRDLLFYLESREGTLAVGRDRVLHSYVNNAAVIGSTYDAVKVVKMVGHFPFFMGLEGGDVLVIGFGIGVTTSAIAQHPEVERIDCVELVPGLRDAAVFYRDLNRDVARDPRLNLIAGDGRHHLQTTTRTYDLISCDPTHPILGSGSLYTRDYFAMCRERLNPGGMVSQYLPLHKLGAAEFLGILRTFQSVFPECTVWLGHYHAVLLGSLEPQRPDFADWRARVAALPYDQQFLLDPDHLAATLVLDGAAIAELGATSHINTDDRSYTEFFAPRCLDDGNLAANLRFLDEHRVGTERVFTGVDDPERLAGYVRGNELLTESLLHRFAGDRAASLAALQAACEAAPEDEEFPFLIKLYF